MKHIGKKTKVTNLIKKCLYSKSLGAAGFFAYIIIALNSLSGLIVNPLILHSVGNNNYGVYSSMHSVIGTLSIVDFGVTQTLIRFISNSIAYQKEENIADIIKKIRTINQVIISLYILISLSMFFNLSYFYKNSFSESEISLSKILFAVFCFTNLISLTNNFYTGIILGYGYFPFCNMIKTFQLTSRFVIVFIIAHFSNDIIHIALVDLIISFLFLFVVILFQKHKIKLYEFSIKAANLKEIIEFMFTIFLLNIVDHINSNIGNLLIGMVVGSTAVTIYSFGSYIHQMFTTFSSSINQMLVPYMSKILAEGYHICYVEKKLILIGQIQFIFLGSIFFGFLSLGKRFICLWLGEEYLSVWFISIILMSTSIIPLVINSLISILKAKNMLIFRSIVLIVSTIMNFGLTFYLLKKYNYICAAFSLGFFSVVSNTIIMCIYYRFKLGYNMTFILFKILLKIGICNIAAASFVNTISFFFTNTYLSFLFLALIYVIIYSFALYKFGLERNLKFITLNIIKRIQHAIAFS